jgi:hypothetical protein
VAVEALLKELQELLHRGEPLALTRVNFLHAPLKLTPNRLGFWSKAKDEGSFHDSFDSSLVRGSESCSRGAFSVESDALCIVFELKYPLRRFSDRSLEIASSAKNSVTLLNCDSARID